VGKAVGEKALARATDIPGFIHDPDRTLQLNSEHLTGTQSRQETPDCFEESFALPGLWYRGLAFPRLTPWAITLPPLTGLRNTFSQIPDSFSASRGLDCSIHID
jgi:hypothetical protein